MKVLVVDDTAFMRMVLRSLLEQMSHDVIAEAKNGKEAVDLYSRFMPDLVTMDITMPEMDGIEAVKQIKMINKDAKIIMCSAMGQRQMVLDAIRSGASDFVIKPIQKERLEEAIDKVFGFKTAVARN
ncbi:response regulator [Paenibacillus sp. SYP-B3998]|uniref:Response regulator n=1 Tax=Paenibacillus sp. SYP-B3998 TaxID=2678564 RepID=A0A6G4A2G1_9BACL|nr:response regulator [Paenibacillus sp. SYP-B3998]